jgi:hypothetical protein
VKSFFSDFFVVERFFAVSKHLFDRSLKYGGQWHFLFSFTIVVFLIFTKNKSENRQPNVLKTTRPLPLEHCLWLVRSTYILLWLRARSAHCCRLFFIAGGRQCICALQFLRNYKKLVALIRIFIDSRAINIMRHFWWKNEWKCFCPRNTGWTIV